MGRQKLVPGDFAASRKVSEKWCLPPKAAPHQTDPRAVAPKLVPSAQLLAGGSGSGDDKMGLQAQEGIH